MNFLSDSISNVNVRIFKVKKFKVLKVRGSKNLKLSFVFCWKCICLNNKSNERYDKFLQFKELNGSNSSSTFFYISNCITTKFTASRTVSDAGFASKIRSGSSRSPSTCSPSSRSSSSWLSSCTVKILLIKPDTVKIWVDYIKRRLNQCHRCKWPNIGKCSCHLVTLDDSHHPMNTENK